MRNDLVSFLSATFLPFYDVTRLHFLAQQKGHRATSLNGPAAREIQYSWYLSPIQYQLINLCFNLPLYFPSHIDFLVTYQSAMVNIQHQLSEKIELQVVLLKKKKS